MRELDKKAIIDVNGGMKCSLLVVLNKNETEAASTSKHTPQWSTERSKQLESAQMKVVAPLL